MFRWNYIGNGTNKREVVSFYFSKNNLFYDTDTD